MSDQSLEWTIKLNAELRKQHERDQRVILAAEKLRDALETAASKFDMHILPGNADQCRQALAEYDKAKR